MIFINSNQTKQIPVNPEKVHIKTALTRSRDIIKLLRVKQWIKNLFVLSPLVFSEQMLTTDSVQNNLSAVISFCLISSAVYIFNDLMDLAADRTHPQKSNRPLASGRISQSLAKKIGLALLLSGLTLGWVVNDHVLIMGVSYIVLNLAYNIHTKKHVFLDVITIAIGFHIRIWAGSLAIGIAPSIWLQACTLVLTLFLGFTKRRHEISLADAKAHEHREVLSQYTVDLLDKAILVCSALAVMFYGLYTLYVRPAQHIERLPLFTSTAFVTYGVFRYIYLIRIKKLGDDAGEIVLKDKPLLICILLWMGFVFLIFYGDRIFL
ncbi:MAG: decaprenyl-phosphate phosphoribosyltransferase [Candidatus Omnitrophica bacterium]|nr:decaprenyl-phosphate phosphoribosyltransferase [Candidatus Omnitrophota bacterium]